MYWYLVQTKLRQEKIAQVNIERLGIEVFSPNLKKKKLIRGKQQIIISPLFPGYLFARFSLKTHYRGVNYAQGVVRLVHFGSGPAIVDDQIIESIRSRVRHGCVNLRDPKFKLGQAVRIHQGTFEGLEAIFEKEVKDHQRAILLLRTLSYQARVVVDLGCVAAS